MTFHRVIFACVQCPNYNNRCQFEITEDPNRLFIKNPERCPWISGVHSAKWTRLVDEVVD